MSLGPLMIDLLGAAITAEEREMMRHRFICPIMSAVIFAYVTSSASAPAAIFRIASGVACGAS